MTTKKIILDEPWKGPKFLDAPIKGLPVKNDDGKMVDSQHSVITVSYQVGDTAEIPEELYENLKAAGIKFHDADDKPVNNPIKTGA